MYTFLNLLLCMRRVYLSLVLFLASPSFPFTHSDPNERAHFWLPESEATTSHQLLESATADRMYIDQGEIVRVRVEADEFYDDEPGPPKAAEGIVIKREARRAPYTIIVSFETMSGRKMLTVLCSAR
jgi:hypothetical protein